MKALIIGNAPLHTFPSFKKFSRIYGCNTAAFNFQIPFTHIGICDVGMLKEYVDFRSIVSPAAQRFLYKRKILVPRYETKDIRSSYFAKCVEFCEEIEYFDNDCAPNLTTGMQCIHHSHKSDLMTYIVGFDQGKSGDHLGDLSAEIQAEMKREFKTYLPHNVLIIDRVRSYLIGRFLK